jgi:PleD family two-component response regulator
MARLLGEADAALYRAKADGRDRTMSAVALTVQ